MIGHQTAMGGMLMVAGRLITRVIDLATMLVLARLLLPTDFGLVAIAASAVTIIEAALELPLNQALVRLPTISRAQLDTAFTLAVLRVAVLTSIILLGAWPVARFYGDPRMFPLICVLALGAGARGLTSPSLATFQRNMSFWRDFVLQLAGKATGFAVGVGIALATGSYWSIAAGAVACPLVIVALSYCYAPYRPRFGLTEMPLFSGFVGWMSAAQVIMAANWQSERLLLGKLQSAAELGLFATASDISIMPIMVIFGPITRPLLAAFSQVRSDKNRLARSYQAVSSGIMTLGLPILVGECLLAGPAIRLIMGDAWLGAVPMLQWLLLSVIPFLFAIAALPLVMSLGDTKIFMKRNILEFCVKMPLLAVSAPMFGFMGIAATRVVSETAAAVYCMLAVRKLIGLSLRDQVFGPWRSFVATLVMAPPVILCVRWFERAPEVPIAAWAAAVTLVAIAAVGAAIFAAALWVLWLMSGRPHGIEAIAMNMIGGMVTRARRPARMES